MVVIKGTCGVAVYPTGVKTWIHKVGVKQSGGGPRGEIGDFSSNSRRRMRERLLQFAWNALISRRRVCWCTLTVREADTVELKRRFDALRKRVMRRYPAAWLVWRLEYQRRGSPHLHLLLVLRTSGQQWEVTHGWLVEQWVDICGGDALPQAQDVRRVRSLQGIACYISDASKVGQSSCPVGERPGRWWGVRGVYAHSYRVRPLMIEGLGEYFFTRDYLGIVREVRYEGIGRKRKFGRIKDSVEFLDPSEMLELFGVTADWEYIKK